FGNGVAPDVFLRLEQMDSHFAVLGRAGIADPGDPIPRLLAAMLDADDFTHTIDAIQIAKASAQTSHIDRVGGLHEGTAALVHAPNPHGYFDLDSFFASASHDRSQSWPGAGHSVSR